MKEAKSNGYIIRYDGYIINHHIDHRSSNRKRRMITMENNRDQEDLGESI
jgi:hypothetical protein